MLQKGVLVTPVQRAVVFWALILVTALTINFIATGKPADSGLLLLLGTVLGGVWGIDAAKALKAKAETADAEKEKGEDHGK